MRRKILLSVLIVFLILALVGCGTTPATDEIKVKNVIQEYFLAINDQNWNKAKSYCIYGSDIYYATCVLEDGINALYQYASTVIIICSIDISNIFISGNYASAYCSGSIMIIADGYHESDSSSGYLHLQKVGNNWKIYDD